MHIFMYVKLPEGTILQRCAANIDLKNWILKIMNIFGIVKNNLQKVTALSFDEVEIMSVYEYGKKEEVLQQHMQV